MIQPVAFADILDAAERLDADAQAELVALLSRRLAERGPERVASAVTQAQREFATGQCQPMTSAEVVSPRRGLADVIREIAAEQRSRGFLGRSAADLRAEDEARSTEDAERDQELDAARRDLAGGA